MFNPGYKIGQVLTNNDIVQKFRCANMGGMRRSYATNTLVIISDYTKGLYHDKWIDGVLHYTGMGKRGDQDINRAQNATLALSCRNGVDVHLFEVINPGEYIYCGRVELVDKPYTEIQPDEDGNNRLVWIFPVKPESDNDFIKPAKYVFKNVAEYKANRKNYDIKYIKENPVETKISRTVRNNSELKGKKIKHKTYGDGTITKYDGTIITVSFMSAGIKKLNYQFCIDNRLIEFI